MTHTEGCIDYAAYLAFEAHAVDTYPSAEATTKGAELLDAEIVDCRCADYPDLQTP
jgi:hypothetical protein